MKLNRAWVAIYVFVIFASGAVLGIYGHRFYEVSSVRADAPRNPDEFRRQYMAEMKARLKLSADQETKLSAILDETRARFRATRDSIEPQIQATRDGIEPDLQRIRDNQQKRIHAILNPEQQAEYDKIRAEREARMKKQGRQRQRP